MIKCYFGVPGCGKSCTLVKEARKFLKKKTYDYIYTINIQIEGCTPINWEDLNNYKFYNSLIIIDEITLNSDSREFKTFPIGIKEFFILHRHLGCDIIYATQYYERADKIIRDLTCELWYVSKSVVPFFKGFTTCKRIYRNININEMNSELVMGYRFCNLLESFFVSNFKLIPRFLYYKYYDSYCESNLENRPLFSNLLNVKE